MGGDTLMKIVLITLLLLSSCSNIHIEEGKRRPKLTVDTPWEECKYRFRSKSVLIKCKYTF